MSEKNSEKLDDIHPAARPFLFLGEKKNKERFYLFPLVGLLVCSVIGIFFPPKHPAPWEKIGDVIIPGNWAIFGFIAYCFIVYMAPILFKWLARPEDFYGEGGLPDPDISTDPMITGEPHHD